MAQGKAQRTCLACRQVKEQTELVRFVCAPDGQVLVDYRHRLPGRGAYACPERGCLEQVVNKRLFARAFKRECQSTGVDMLVGSLRDALLVRMANLLGMARKSGRSVAGSNAVLASFDRPNAPLLIVFATDISAGVAAKVNRKAGHHAAERLTLFDKLELGRMLGRSECSVFALTDKALTEAFLLEWKRYCRILGEN